MLEGVLGEVWQAYRYGARGGDTLILVVSIFALAAIFLLVLVDISLLTAAVAAFLYIELLIICHERMPDNRAQADPFPGWWVFIATLLTIVVVTLAVSYV